jgi:hypothetical protein
LISQFKVFPEISSNELFWPKFKSFDLSFKNQSGLQPISIIFVLVWFQNPKVVTFPLQELRKKDFKACFQKHGFQNHFTKAFSSSFPKTLLPSSLGYQVVAGDLIGSVS